MPLVSVVTPVFNTEYFMRYCIDSVLQQSLSEWELILVDDGSFDNSFDIIDKYKANDHRIKVISLAQSLGPALARNKAIELASGRYIAFLDADDAWLPKKLERQIEFMNAIGAHFSYSAYEKINENGNIIGQVDAPVTVDYRRMIKGSFIGCLTAMYDTHYFGKVYMPEIRKRQDLGLWLKLLKMTDKAYGIQEVLAQYRVHENSLSANKLSAARYTWKLYRKVEKLSLAKSSWYFSHYALRSLTKAKAPGLAEKLGW